MNDDSDFVFNGDRFINYILNVYHVLFECRQCVSRMFYS